MSRVFGFYSADHRTGTSMIAQCAAERLAERERGRQILLVHSSDCAGTDYSPQMRESVGRIRPYLADRLINVEEIRRKAVWRDNLSVIGGPDDPCGASDIYPEMGEYLIRTMAPFYDAVICDGGAEIDQGLALGAMFASDSLFMVITQSENCLKRYEWMLPVYRQLSLAPGRYIVNLYSAASPYSESYLCDRLGIDRGAVMKIRASEYGHAAETDSRSLLSYRDKAFLKDLDELVTELINEL